MLDGVGASFFQQSCTTFLKLHAGHTRPRARGEVCQEFVYQTCSVREGDRGLCGVNEQGTLQGWPIIYKIACLCVAISCEVFGESRNSRKMFS